MEMGRQQNLADKKQQRLMALHSMFEIWNEQTSGQTMDD
jgi:hypothetical protein